MSKYFKTDGIRGRYNEFITLDLAFKVGSFLNLLGDKVVIGYDTRESSEKLKDSLIQGSKFSGLIVYDLGLSSTPRVEFYSKLYGCLGVMITASHNPYYDNGIKVFKNGIKINVEEERLLENYICNSYEDLLIKKMECVDFDVCLDLDNGGLCYFKNKLSEKFHLLNVDYNGININDKCGSLYPLVVRDCVLTNGYKCGFSFDGDGDRVIGVDEFGNIYDGDILAYILVKYNKYQSVVVSKMVNYGVVDAYKRLGVNVYFSDSGDKNILDLMDRYNVMVGSESSGHIIHKKYGNSGDGLLNALDIIKIISEGFNISECFDEIKLYPALLKNYNVKYNNIEYLYSLISENYPEIIPYIRVSGTENVLRIYLQGNNLLDCFSMLEDELCKL